MSAELELTHDDASGEVSAVILRPHGIHELELDAEVDEESGEEKGVIIVGSADMFPPETERALEGLNDDAGAPVIADDEDDSAPEAETAEEVNIKNGVYHEIRRKLNERFRIPLEQIAFAHDANTPERKAALYKAVNDGQVRVLIGSTGKMGTGVNVQRRLVALHHVDQPWKPAEKEQREGRLLRQGNIYEQVFVFDYVTEGSFDAYMAQTLESKARFISQITAGEVTARTAEDVGDMVLTLAQVKAIASGNPLVQRRIELEVKLVKLDRLRASFYNNRTNMRDELESLPNDIAAQETQLAGHQSALARREPLNDEKFSITLREILSANGGDAKLVTFDKRERAGSHLRLLTDLAIERLRDRGGSSVNQYVGTYRGFEVRVQAWGNNRFARISSLFDLKTEIRLCVPGSDTYYTGTISESNVGITQSIDWQLRHIEDSLAQAEQMLAQLRTRLTNINGEIERPWAHAREYRRLRRAYEEMGRALEADGVRLESQTTFAADEADAGDADDEAIDVQAAAAADEVETRRNPFTGLEDWAISVPEPFDENASLQEDAGGGSAGLFAALAEDAGRSKDDPFLIDADAENAGCGYDEHDAPTSDGEVPEKADASDSNIFGEETCGTLQSPTPTTVSLVGKRKQKKQPAKREERKQQSTLLFG